MLSFSIKSFLSSIIILNMSFLLTLFFPLNDIISLNMEQKYSIVSAGKFVSDTNFKIDGEIIKHISYMNILLRTRGTSRVTTVLYCVRPYPKSASTNDIHQIFLQDFTYIKLMCSFPELFVVHHDITTLVYLIMQ